MDPKRKLTLKLLRDCVSADSYGRTREGNLIVRRGFYFTHGETAEDFRDRVVSQLTACDVEAHVVDYGEVWKPFRGGASVAQSSHWYVVLA